MDGVCKEGHVAERTGEGGCAGQEKMDQRDPSGSPQGCLALC